MSKLYNIFSNHTSNLSHFFNSLDNFNKHHTKILSLIIFSILSSNSINYNNIASNLFSNALHDSSLKRIKRFINNKNFDINKFYSSFIHHIIAHFKSKHYNSVDISFDHCFISRKWIILVFSLRIGKTGIPLWFKSFKYEENTNAFDFEQIKEGIDFIFNLFSGFTINLLADRGFFSIKTFSYINSLPNVFYFIRSKGDILIRPTHGKLFGNTLFLKDIPINMNRSKYFFNAYITKKEFAANVAISMGSLSNDDDNWYIITNANPKTAIRQYNKRFGSIETIFKNAKSNGFYLEETGVKSLFAFNNIFGLVSICISWMVTIGSYVNKNKLNKYVGAVKKVKNRYIRILSLFNTGMVWFKKSLFSPNPLFTLKFNFILYDV